ncbi:MAG: CcoQ/FixQ family Cbb3-type cytochrome c oxidase assembly chaperone [Pusillimonas sp.]
MMGVINGIVTLLALLTFIGIVVWAFSRGRAKANTEAAMLPFALPDEGEVKQGQGNGTSTRSSAGGSHE